MHARVISVQLKPGSSEDVTRIYRDSVLPAARRQPGFRRGRQGLSSLREFLQGRAVGVGGEQEVHGPILPCFRGCPCRDASA